MQMVCLLGEKRPDTLVLGGKFTFNCRQSEASFYLTAAPDGLYNHAWLYEQVHYFQFHLRTCHGAFIYIGETPVSSDDSHKAYEVYLEGAEDATSRITRYVG